MHKFVHQCDDQEHKSQHHCSGTARMRVAEALSLAALAALLGSAAGALDTCEGAVDKWGELWSAPCAREKKAGDGEEEHTPASCGSAECAALISSIDDDVLAKMKQGLKVCQSAQVSAHLWQIATFANFCSRKC
jgi:hypothetical protein